jgi:hypothetical protein
MAVAVGDDSLDPPGHAPRPRQPSLSPMQTTPPRDADMSDRNGAAENRRDALTPMPAAANPDSSPDPRQDMAARTIQRAFRAHRARADVGSRHEPPSSPKIQEPERPTANSPTPTGQKDFIGFIDEVGTFQTPLKIGPFNITARGSVSPSVAKRYGLPEQHPEQPSRTPHAPEPHTEESSGAPKRTIGFGELRVGGLLGGHVLAHMAKRAQAQQSRAPPDQTKSGADKPSPPPTHSPPAKSGGDKSGR